MYIKRNALYFVISAFRYGFTNRRDVPQTTTLPMTHK